MTSSYFFFFFFFFLSFVLFSLCFPCSDCRVVVRVRRRFPRLLLYNVELCVCVLSLLPRFATYIDTGIRYRERERKKVASFSSSSSFSTNPSSLHPSRQRRRRRRIKPSCIESIDCVRALRATISTKTKDSFFVYVRERRENDIDDAEKGKAYTDDSIATVQANKLCCFLQLTRKNRGKKEIKLEWQSLLFMFNEKKNLSSYIIISSIF